jgi:hypothetical protein
MSTLIILGNTNVGTFVNSIALASNKALELFHGEALKDIFVIHTTESFDILNTQRGWIDYLKENKISSELLIQKVVDVDASEKSVEKFVHYIEIIVRGVVSENSNLIVDLTNGTSLYKNLLSTAAYVLDLRHQYLIDIIKASDLTKEIGGPRGFIAPEILKESYVPVPPATQLDSIAYLSLVEIIRYKKIIEKQTEKYVQLSSNGSNKEPFEDNLARSVQLKLQSDRKRDDAIYRIATSSISLNIEDLLGKMIDRFDLDNQSSEGSRRTLGNKLNLIQSKIGERASGNFDFEFFKKFNDFMLYLRNSSTHKGFTYRDIERFKADLAVKMSFPFIEFYTDIIYPLLEVDNDLEQLKKIKRLSAANVKPDDILYFGLDGDDTGAILEELFLLACDETTFRKTSKAVSKAIDELTNCIKKSLPRGEIVFNAGDDILFKGILDVSMLEKLKEMYYDISGLTCSIGYGKTFREVYLALKLAKTEPGKNRIVGIEFG